MSKLTADHHADLCELNRIGIGYPNERTPLLASLGLVVVGKSRFGGFVKPTAAGKDASRSAAGAGASQRSPARVQPRVTAQAATNARSTPSAISPPAEAQHVGAATSTRRARK